MAVEVTRVAVFGPGSTGYRFKVLVDKEMDLQLYKIGRELEQARFTKGTLGQRMFDRLGSATLKERPNDK